MMNLQSKHFRKIIKMVVDLLEDCKEVDAHKALKYFQDKDMSKIDPNFPYEPIATDVEDYIVFPTPSHKESG